MPSAVNWCTQSKLFSRQYLQSVSLIFPICMTFVFVMFTLRPDLTWNQSRIFRLFLGSVPRLQGILRCCLHIGRAYVLYRARLYLSHFYHFLKANARYSEHKIQIYGDIRSPCLQPLSSGKGSDRYLFKIMREFEFS